MWLQLIIIPCIGALIGWLTNYLAIKLIFRPFHPWKIPFTPWAIQGLIPKRQAEIATNVGRVIENELLSMEDILSEVSKDQKKHQLIALISNLLKQRVYDRLPGFLPNSVKNVIVGMLDDTLRKEAPIVLEQLTDNISKDLLKEVKVEHLVENKLKQFDLQQFERLVFHIAATELKHIEVLGAVLGFIIGLVQVAVFYFTR
ncbi:MAG: DUF445 family protein [Thermoanaerobacteraceae bacterium]|nr:DUF445 family protein [Thermoanaerobacteraceae bacterium]